MAQEPQPVDRPELGALVGEVARDMERLVGQHLDLLRAEVGEQLREARLAATSMGAGAGLVAAGGILGSLMVVHALHRSTRLPLWSCYGAVGGLLAVGGASLLAGGARRAAGLSLVPTQTVEAIGEDLRWAKGQMDQPAS